MRTPVEEADKRKKWLTFISLKNNDIDINVEWVM